MLPMHPSSGASTVGVITSSLMAASMVWAWYRIQLVHTEDSNELETIKKDTLTVQPIFASADPLADATAPRFWKDGFLARVWLFRYTKRRGNMIKGYERQID